MKNIAPDSRCFELRTYTIRPEGPGDLDMLHKRFREHTNRLFIKHGMTIVGFWHRHKFELPGFLPVAIERKEEEMAFFDRLTAVEDDYSDF